MKIEINNLTKHKIDLKLIKQVVLKFARFHRIRQKEISIALVGDAEIKKLNQTYRRLDEPTDILSFTPLNSAESNLTGPAGDYDFLGELVIDYDQIKRQAGEFKKTTEEEMIFILVHGLLHLRGYNDENEADRQKMVEAGEEFIRKNF